MPPKRQASGTARTAKQSTLAFHGSSNKVTKSGARAQTAKKNLSDVKKSAVEQEAERGDVLKSPHFEPTVVEKPAKSAVKEQPASTPEEIEARKITEKRIKQYWAEKEKSRRAARVHQDDLSVHEKILREFDMSSHYGPCVGISRLRRWQRAHRLKLNPPIEVLAVLLKEQEGGDANMVQRSRMDELLNSNGLELEMGVV
ncbi:uncharacterized protein EI97DRAFT_435973 [Westerdykella ornata]|uniref:DNA polymerase delta subunit 4 n=1 Tax=Westerdykella ornata TaxID=318751 RepID=A0A6A6JAC1_WESOR|nr:uncharacterized protein EI97DRAFT_435973 [Westerdykella ornata]KAF2273550.1 hypothetical protein EI97DRAFT_435973 [Westerdykella ornata]